MDAESRRQLKAAIDAAEVVSFDVFDTLLFRRVNEPETIFDLTGRHFTIHGFRKLRTDSQVEASRRATLEFGYPHADMDQIYAVLAEHREIPVDWEAVKAYEITLEQEALTANPEMQEIFRYAKAQGKRVIAVSDMYLFAATLQEILEQNGYQGFDHIYCSADEHKAKFNRDLFALVAEKEGIAFDRMLHIGDKERDDGEYPASYGIRTFVYRRKVDLEKIRRVADADIDKGLYKILCREDKEGEDPFWYNLGIEVGGPLYMALFLWMKEQMAASAKKVFFLSRDGYNLYQLFKDAGYTNIEYLYISRRATLLAGITELDEEALAQLPPFTKGQTVGEILDYLCIPREEITRLSQAGFSDFTDRIRDDGDIAAMKQLYILEREVILRTCEKERRYAADYFRKVGLTEADSLAFDCGWNGSSQYLLERVKKALGCPVSTEFYYFGIRNTARSRKQLHGLHYQTFLFDFYKNQALHSGVDEAVAMYELFFSAPHESVHYYDAQGPVLEAVGGSREKAEILQGIRDYVRFGHSFAEKYQIEYLPEVAIARLQRLIQDPTDEEAVRIGNLGSVDGFVRTEGSTDCLAYLTRFQMEKNPHSVVYWVKGLLKRSDIAEDVKLAVAARYGVPYPKKEQSYRLEDSYSYGSYRRFLRRQEDLREPYRELHYQPKFSVVIPVYNTVTEQLEEAFDSVLRQSYRNFELILVDDHSSWENVRPVLRRYEKLEQVRVIYRESNGHIAAATNDGIALACGDYIVFMDCDDTIDRDALYEMAKKLNEDPALDMIYSDEDKLTEDGKVLHMPFFKPDWSPDLFMNLTYLNHLAVYRASIVKELGGLRGAYNGSQDVDLNLRFMEKTTNRQIAHIPRVLYHWRERKESIAAGFTAKSYAVEAVRNARMDALKRRGLRGHMEYIPGISQWRTVYAVEGNPLVSIIIPSKDNPEILKQCIDSLHAFTAYDRYEIIVVDNGSCETNRRELEAYLDAAGAAYRYQPADFNFSAMCNAGAAAAKGDYLLFLNDDIEMFAPDWLTRMLGQAALPHVGAVGAKLYYPETTLIQHAGVANIYEGPSHTFTHCDDENVYYFGWNRLDYDCIAVTGACLLLRAETFREIGGFDESMPVAYNDVDLCFTLYEHGYYNVIRDDAVAYHYESLSRGVDQEDDEKVFRLSREWERLYRKHPALKHRDPFLNANLHNWTGGLDILDNYNEVKIADLTGTVEGGNGNIDGIQISDRIQISGWAFAEGEETAEKYFLFRDPYGIVYQVTAEAIYRQDVAEAFGNREELQFAGMESIVDKAALRMDILPYVCGILLCTVSGRKYVIWKDKSPVVRSPKERPQISECTVSEGFVQHPASRELSWYLDEHDRKEDHFSIRGFAFVKNNLHYQYRLRVFLLPEEGKAIEVRHCHEERVDVAYSFPELHFLYETGFQCRILPEQLESGRSYQILLRLENQFEKADIQDIPTGQVLEA